MVSLNCKGRVSEQLLEKAKAALDEWSKGNIKGKKSHKWKDIVISMDRKRRLVLLKEQDTAFLFVTHKDYERFIDRKKPSSFGRFTFTA